MKKERLDEIMMYQRKPKYLLLLAVVFAVLLSFSTIFAEPYPTEKKGTLPKDTAGKVIQAASGELDPEGKETIVYDSVEMRWYEGEGAHPYIHDVKTNHTTKSIVGYQYGMLAFDKEGNPLEIDWHSLDTDIESSYYYLHEENLVEIDPGETEDVFGGWSLNIFGADPEVEKIAYVLYCNKEITFEDGKVWENPDFQKWLDAYRGKKTDVSVLKNYYPYEQQIIF